MIKEDNVITCNCCFKLGVEIICSECGQSVCRDCTITKNNDDPYICFNCID